MVFFRLFDPVEKSGGAGGGSNPDGAEQQPVVLRETDKRHKYR